MAVIEWEINEMSSLCVYISYISNNKWEHFMGINRDTHSIKIWMTVGYI